jgi:hypothetical protein
VTVGATGLTLTILAFRALGRATVGTGMAARGTGLVVTALTGGLGCMDGGSGVGDGRRSREAVFGEDSAGEIIKGELGWEGSALDLEFLEATKQGGGGSAIFRSCFEAIEVHLGLFKWCENSVGADPQGEVSF